MSKVENRGSELPPVAIPLPVARPAAAGIPPEIYPDLLREATERGITVMQAYQEELEAQRRLAEITPPLEEVLRIARLGGAPEYLKNT